jgi:phosphonate transport system permease protein
MLELSIRVSAVIGLVGAGGIGQLLNVERVYFHWDNVSAIVLAMTAMIVILEIISTSVRSRLLR